MSVNPEAIEKMTSLRSGVKVSFMSYNKMGIYLNQPKAVELKIIYNKRDAAKVKDPSKILKVNRDNVKFGKSKNLDARHREYKEIFEKNTNFKIILQINDYEKLVCVVLLYRINKNKSKKKKQKYQKVP